MQLFNRSLATGLLVLLMLAGARSTQLAWADREFRAATGPSVRAAARVEPGRALYQVGVAESQISAGADPRPALRRAISLQPDKADYRIRLGLQAEQAGDHEEAEGQLLEAARVSRKYAPRWTLANYYIRRGEFERFWPWAKKALLVSYSNRQALFDLCRAATADMSEILARAIPDRRVARMDFAGYLLQSREWELATGILSHLAANAAPEESTRFLLYVDRLLAGGNFRGAATIWNALADSDRTGSRGRLELGSANRITNADFALPPLNHAFGWRVPELDGVYHSPVPTGGWQVTLTGEQPETGEILWQFLPLEGGTRYRLGFEYQVSASPFASPSDSTGLSWRLESGHYLAESAYLDATERHLVWEFTIPEKAGLGRVVLYHRRKRGSMRMEGTIRLERVTLEVLGQPSSKM